MYDLTTVAQQDPAADDARHAGAPPSRTAAGLAAMIDRIAETIDSETAGIRQGAGSFDIKAANARKSRHLYELSKVLKGIDSGELLAQHEAALRRLRDKLALNERAILAHMSAVGEVAELVQNAIQRVETDGTYSAHEFARAGA